MPDLTPTQLCALLATLPVDDPLVVAARLGLEIGANRAWPGLNDYIDGRWYREHTLSEFSDLDRKRYPPTGDRDLWIRYGPAGPPADQTRLEAA